jgi:hypothetical protein
MTACQGGQTPRGRYPGGRQRKSFGGGEEPGKGLRSARPAMANAGKACGVQACGPGRGLRCRCHIGGSLPYEGKPGAPIYRQFLQENRTRGFAPGPPLGDDPLDPLDAGAVSGTPARTSGSRARVARPNRLTDSNRLLERAQMAGSHARTSGDRQPGRVLESTRRRQGRRSPGRKDRSRTGRPCGPMRLLSSGSQ